VLVIIERKFLQATQRSVHLASGRGQPLQSLIRAHNKFRRAGFLQSAM